MLPVRRAGKMLNLNLELRNRCLKLIMNIHGISFARTVAMNIWTVGNVGAVMVIFNATTVRSHLDSKRK